MNWLDVLFYTVGGLGLFFYGMYRMSEGLKRSSSDTIRNVLSHLTRNRLLGVLVGTAITATIQSSSAVTVMTVGFVNAGLLSLREAVAVVIGSNIGTTMTAWLVSITGTFKIGYYALPAIGVGFFLMTIPKKRPLRIFGEVLFGFGVLFFGLDVMKDAFAPLKDNPRIMSVFAYFGHNPLLGVLLGTVFTILLQSSSATIAILQVMAFSGLISFPAAVPIILGDNIGTTITAQLGALRANVNARRTAMAHSLFNIFGVCLILPFVYLGWYARLVDWIVPGDVTTSNIMVHLAAAHSIFNIINAVVFTIFIDFLTKTATRITPHRVREDEAERTPRLLEEHLIDNPVIAMQQVVRELVRMTRLAKRTVHQAREAFFTGNEDLLQRVRTNEEAIDDFQRAITRYLIRVSAHHLDTRESMEYPVLLHSVNDVEKIGDYCSNIANYTEIKLTRKIQLEERSAEYLRTMFAKLDELFDHVIGSLGERNVDKARLAVGIEDQLDEMKRQCRVNYIEGLKADRGLPEAHILVMDVATNIEKMGDHLVNIAKAVLKDLQWGKKIVLEGAGK